MTTTARSNLMHQKRVENGRRRARLLCRHCGTLKPKPGRCPNCLNLPTFRGRPAK